MRNLHELIPYPELENWQKALIRRYITDGTPYRVRVTRVRKEVSLQARRWDRWMNRNTWRTLTFWDATNILTIRQIRDQAARFDPNVVNWQIL